MGGGGHFFSEYAGGGRGGARGAKLFAGCKLIGPPAPDQCQIITFLTLKTDNIAKVSKELEGEVLNLTPPPPHTHTYTQNK